MKQQKTTKTVHCPLLSFPSAAWECVSPSAAWQTSSPKETTEDNENRLLSTLVVPKRRLANLNHQNKLKTGARVRHEATLKKQQESKTRQQKHKTTTTH